MADARKPILFDTDPGIDDAMALALIGATPGLELLGITSVFGNAAVAETTRNAQYLADRYGLDVPVRAGAAGPLVGERRPAPAYVHGESGLGPADLSRFTPPPVDAEPAHQFIARTIRARPGAVTLVAVGPLTNLALLLREAPDVAGLVDEVVVMGGAFAWHRRRGNVSPVAEANVMNDPEAADLVLGADWRVTMVGLDVTMPSILTPAEAARLARDGGDTGRFLHDISRAYSAMYRTYDGIEGCCLHDIAAVAYASDPQIFTVERGPIRVVTGGIARGQTIQQPEDLMFPEGAWDGRPAQQACRTVADGAVARLFVDRLVAAAR